MTYTGQAEDWTEGSLSANTENSMSTRTKISMDNDLHRSSKSWIEIAMSTRTETTMSHDLHRSGRRLDRGLAEQQN